MEKNKLGKQEVNSMMAIPSHDDFSRELFIQEFLWKLNTEFVNKFENLFPNNEPSKLKIKLEDVAKQRKVFLDNSSGKIWSSLRRIGREWTCEAVGPTVEKQLPSLINKSKSLINKKNKLGSLKLDKNMNIPNIPKQKCQGIQITSQGKRVYGDRIVKRKDPRGVDYFWIGGDKLNSKNEIDTDFWALETNHISVTPIKMDLTDEEQKRDLLNWNLDEFI